MLKMLYTNKLKYLREEKEITQIEISKILKIDNACYAHYEREDNIIPIKHLNTLCDFYNVSLDYIFSFTYIKQYENSRKEIDFDISSKRLKEFRKENKLTQVKLAKILNASPSVLVHHENKRHVIATPFLYTICKKYGISADYLLGKTDTPKTF